MYQRKTSLRTLSLLSASMLMLAACSAGTQEESPESQPQTPATSSPATSPPAESSSATQSATAPESASASDSGSGSGEELGQIHEIHGIHFSTPEGWSVEGDDCDGECTQWDEWEVKNEQRQHVLTLIPATATSPDGDMNLYQRELLAQEALPDPQMPGMDFQPTSLIAEFWESTDQEDGEKDSGFDIALVDDQVLAERGEQPDLNHFKIGEQSPMFWVEDDYLETHGVPDDPSKQQAQQFLQTPQYELVRDILLSVRPAAG